MVSQKNLRLLPAPLVQWQHVELFYRRSRVQGSLTPVREKRMSRRRRKRRENMIKQKHHEQVPAPLVEWQHIDLLFRRFLVRGSLTPVRDKRNKRQRRRRRRRWRRENMINTKIHFLLVPLVQWQHVELLFRRSRVQGSLTPVREKTMSRRRRKRRRENMIKQKNQDLLPAPLVEWQHIELLFQRSRV